MKPMGIKFVGPVCVWGCCYKQNPRTSPPSRRIGHNGTRADKKRERQAGKKIAKDMS